MLINKRVMLLLAISALMALIINQDSMFWGHSGLLFLLSSIFPGFTIGMFIPLGDDEFIYFVVSIIINVIYQELVYRLFIKIKKHSQTTQ